jgi:serine/threonine protein kinase
MKEKNKKEENKSIHEFDFNLICEYFSSVKRQGPGGEEETKKALSFMKSLLKFLPEERISASEALNHPYFDGIRE